MSAQPAGVYRMQTPARARAFAAALRRDLVVLLLAAQEPDVPLLAKLCAVVVAAYAVSPIDLIPDFIPVIGLLDDLLLLPLGIWLTLQLIPAPVRQDFRCRARDAEPSGLWWLGALMVVGPWLAVLLTAASFLEEAI